MTPRPFVSTACGSWAPARGALARRELERLAAGGELDDGEPSLRARASSRVLVGCGRTLGEFLRLRRECDLRLRASGFDDIESRATGMLRGISVSELERAPTALEFEATVEWYSRLEEFAHHGEWGSSDAERELRAIWELHAEGCSVREIATASGRSVTRTHAILRRLEKRFKTWWVAGAADREAANEETLQ
jgi:hypothetical protein